MRKKLQTMKVSDLKVLMSEKVLMNDADDQQKSHQQEWPQWADPFEKTENFPGGFAHGPPVNQEVLYQLHVF